MKTLSYFRFLFAIAISIGLSSCGGYTTVTLGGPVTGLTATGLVLVNAGIEYEVPINATSYTFPDKIDDHGTYAVTQKLPQPSQLTCSVINASGKATGVNVENVAVICIHNTWSLGGAINVPVVSTANLTGLELANGSVRATPVLVPATTATAAVPIVVPAHYTFTFPSVVREGDPYSIVVLHQPTDGVLMCTVAPASSTTAPGTAIMGGGNVTTVAVNCI